MSRSQSPMVVALPPSVFPTTKDFMTIQGFSISSEDSLGGSPSVLERKGSVGWQGLLEVSQAIGSAGVLGYQNMELEGDLSMDDGHIEVSCMAHTTPGVRRLVKSVIRGMKACQEPERASEGLGGTYFFMNENGRKVAILKPCDEEPLAPNNPKGYVGRNLGDAGWKKTVRVGEAAMREVAAYLLDHDHFAKVPHTALVRARHPIFHYSLKPPAQRSFSRGSLPASDAKGADMQWADDVMGKDMMKLGSLQEFVYHECDTTEMGTSKFSVKDVHRIGILDIRLFNTDRHGGNILVRVPKDSSANLRAVLEGQQQYELIPIDHGFCLPEALEAPYFEWLHWPQTMLPFCDEHLQYIGDLNVQADKELLMKELPNLRPECLRILELSTTLLKKCAAAGLTLYEIASVMTRPLLADEPSPLERICMLARQTIDSMVEGLPVCKELPGIVGDGADSENSECDSYIPAQLGSGSGEDSLTAAMSLGSPLPTIRVGREDDMLFDLDDESGNGVSLLGTANKNLSVVSLECQPNSPFSEDSSVSCADHVSLMTVGSNASAAAASLVATATATFTIGGAGKGKPEVTKSNLAGMMVNMGTNSEDECRQPTTKALVPQSVCGDALMMKAQLAAMRKVASKVRLVNLPGRAAYPPPVVMKDGVMDVFSNLDEEQWIHFMDLVVYHIDVALESGCWCQGSGIAGAAALSCPRF